MTLAELAEAYKTDKNLKPMMLDNDAVSVTRVDEAADPDWLHAEDVYEAHPDELVEQALGLLGIPWERV